MGVKWHAWTMRKNKITKIEHQNNSYQNTNRNNNLPVSSFFFYFFFSANFIRQDMLVDNIKNKINE